MFYSFVKAILTPILFFLFNIKYEGMENLPENGGYVICSNHRTLWDPILIAYGVKKRNICFMAKKELFRSKLLGGIISKLGAFPVNRGAGDKSALKYAEEAVKKGNILLIFPEGTRSKTRNPLRVKTGAAYIAVNAGSDVIPTALCFSDSKFFIRRKVTVCFGKPIKNSEMVINEQSRSADAHKISNNIMEKIVNILNLHSTHPVTMPAANKGAEKI